MKKYIGTKEVKATPMNRGEYNQYRGWNIPANENPNDEGYLVECTDDSKPNDERHEGYISWSPKDVFEKAYNVAETPVDRMLIETNEVEDRYVKLAAFIDSGKMNEVVDGAYDKCLLEIQCSTMFDYIRLLGVRTKRMEGSKSATLLRMNFGMAIQALKSGYAVRRKDWYKNIFIVKQNPAHITKEVIPGMQSLPQSAKDIVLSRDNKYIDYANQMLLMQPDGTADSWVPSSSDVFAEDWEIVLSE